MKHLLTVRIFVWEHLSPQYYAFLGQNDIRKKIGKRKKQKTGSV